MGLRSYRELAVWRQSLDLVDLVYQLIRGFPVDERFAMTSQMIRAVVSIPANIAEGCGSGYRKQFLRHLGIARGSLAELETYVEIALRRRYLTDEQSRQLMSQCQTIGRMSAGLCAALKRKKAE